MSPPPSYNSKTGVLTEPLIQFHQHRAVESYHKGWRKFDDGMCPEMDADLS